VLKAVIGALPAVAASVQDPAIAAAATPADLKLAIASAAQSLIGTQSAFDATTLKADIGVSKLPADTTSSAAEASATLRSLSYTDASHWAYRAMEASAADNTPDANGKIHYYDVHTESEVGIGGVFVRSWGQGNDKERDDLHWNGAAWVNCPLGFRSSNEPRDAQGRSHYNYCDNFETGVSVRSALDIGGKTLRSVIVDTVRTFPGCRQRPDLRELRPGQPRPARHGDLSDRLEALLLRQPAARHRTRVRRPRNQCRDRLQRSRGRRRRRAHQLAGVCQCRHGRDGDDARDAGGAQPRQALHLQPGHQCRRQQPRPQRSLGPEQRGHRLGRQRDDAARRHRQLLQHDGALRVAFTGAGNATTYYSCLMRRADLSPRNCTLVGSGSYRIDTLGDAR
jgi:hypothetical protein